MVNFLFAVWSAESSEFAIKTKLLPKKFKSDAEWRCLINEFCLRSEVFIVTRKRSGEKGSRFHLILCGLYEWKKIIWSWLWEFVRFLDVERRKFLLHMLLMWSYKVILEESVWKHLSLISFRTILVVERQKRQSREKFHHFFVCSWV